MKINNKISEPLCSTEVSKLLAELGFRVSTEANLWILAKDHTDNYNKGLPLDESKVFFAKNADELDQKTYIDGDVEHEVFHVLSIPTQAVVLEWLTVNFEVIVLPFIQFENEGAFDETLKETLEFTYYLFDLKEMRETGYNVLPYINVGVGDFVIKNPENPNDGWRTREEATNGGLLEALKKLIKKQKLTKQ